MIIDSALIQLENEQILKRLKEDDTYSFKHSLTQETVYQGLLKSQRRAMHRAIAEAMEEIYADRKGKMSDVLAYHWELAEVPDRARRYLLRAAQNALRSYANQEALGLLTRALAQSEGAKPQDLMALHEMRAQVYESLDQYGCSLEDYQAALPLARQSQRAVDECRILSRIAWALCLCGKGDRAVTVAEEAEKIALEQQDQTAVLRAYLVQGLAEQARGELMGANTRMRTALMASQFSEQVVVEGESWYYLGIQYDLMGRFARAAACARKAGEIKKGLSDHGGEILSLFLRARAEGARGHYDASLDALEQGHARAKEIRHPFGLAEYPNTRAWLAGELGDWQTAYELDREGLQVAHHALVHPPEINTLLNLFLDCAMLGYVEESEDYCHKLAQWMGHPEFGHHLWRWQVRYDDAHARLLMAQSLYDEAAGVINKLIKESEHTLSAKYRARGLVLRAQIHLYNGERQQAQIDLFTARHLADGMNYVPVRIQARQLLAQSIAQTDPNKSREYLAQAARIVQVTKACVTYPELKRSFDRGMGTWVTLTT
jgi:tetratricopeptide (TPR) repeat protein